MPIKDVLWLEDQSEDFSSYHNELYKFGYLVDSVRSVSEAEQKLRDKDFFAFICDIKVLPGDDEKWINLDEAKRRANPNFDSYLGFEFLQSLYARPHLVNVPLDPPNLRDKIPPNRVIVFSVVYNKIEDILELGILKGQFIYKSSSNIRTLPQKLNTMLNAE